MLGNLQTNEEQAPEMEVIPLSVESESLICINWGLINVPKEKLSDFQWAATIPATAFTGC